MHYVHKVVCGCYTQVSKVKLSVGVAWFSKVSKWYLFILDPKVKGQFRPYPRSKRLLIRSSLKMVFFIQGPNGCLFDPVLKWCFQVQVQTGAYPTHSYPGPNGSLFDPASKCCFQVPVQTDAYPIQFQNGIFRSLSQFGSHSGSFSEMRM